MRVEPDPANLFPDVAALGSLATALCAVGEARGYALDVVQNENDRLRAASVPTSRTGREPLAVNGWRLERCWSISGFGCGGGTESRWLISGATQDLGWIAVAAYGWQSGLPLAEIERLTPFVELTGHIEVPDDSPVHAIASEWAYLRKEAERSDWMEHRALIEAAYARREMRQLYAFTSHWSLRLAAAPAKSRPDDLICLEASRGGRFTLRSKWKGPVIGRATTAEEAVSLAVAHLPADTGLERLG
ncbi:DUF6193 family natural product biosynthesis protein [Micromonospora sp. CPCC 205546]|uniref:DUF6193 family natural product biosynthesis protein n=1 Tax=Micromonospora sp. CPCC 205546 TaxID=3122397 RepID=UPI003FA52411